MKRDNLFLILLVLCAIRCNLVSNRENIRLSLDVVRTNYPVVEVDTINPLPQITFTLTFKNISENICDLVFDDLSKSLDNNSTFFARLCCSNNQIIELPLYEVSGKSIHLVSGEEVNRSFKVRSSILKKHLINCGERYLGEIMEQATKSVTFIYRKKERNIEYKCKRKKFEAPDYFMIE